MVPFIDEDDRPRRLPQPGVGVVDSLQAGTLMREEAQRAGRADGVRRAPRSRASTSNRGRIRRVRTDRGDIETRGRRHRLRRLEPAHRADGRSVDPAHARGSPDDRHRARARVRWTTVGEIGFPIVRDMDTNMYERQHGSEFEIGSYAHRPILIDPDDIPSIEEAALSPTMLPFTQEDFDPQLEDALELFPEIVGDETRRHEATRSTACSRSRPTATRSSARRPRSRASGRPRPSGSRRRRGSPARSPSG